MNPATFERFSTVIAERNAQEIARRTEYHQQLVESRAESGNRAGGDRGTVGRWLLAHLARRLVGTERPWGEPGSLDDFLMRYSSLSTWGEPVTDEVITAMQPAIPFPAELVEFYRTRGWLSMGQDLGNFSILSLVALQSALTSERPYDRFRSMGLADSIVRVWGNDRPELDPSGDAARYTREQVDRLNGDYQVVAVWEDVGSANEAHFYIYFDRSQRFGVVHLHQDDWEHWPAIESPACSSEPSTDPPLSSTKLERLLEASEADRSWDQVLNDALDWLEDRADPSD
jgi:hypothetical protein